MTGPPGATEYEWMDGAVPGGVEIAQVVLESRRVHGWQATFAAKSEGFQVCPRVRIWLDGYSDRDYEEAFLLRVWTTSEPGPDGRTVTVTDHLAVFTGEGNKVDVEWRQDPRLFFDAGRDWIYDGLSWWVNWMEGLSEARLAEHLPPAAAAAIAEHNRKVIDRDRQVALALGLGPALPYLANLEVQSDRNPNPERASDNPSPG